MSIYQQISKYVPDDVTLDILHSLDYISLLSLVEASPEYKNFLNNIFWKKFAQKYDVEECIKNNWFVLLYYKIDEIDPQNTWIRYFDDSNVESFKVLLTYTKYRPSMYNNHAIIHAVDHGNTKIVELLLSTGTVDVTARDNSAMITACKDGYHKIVKLLLSYSDFTRGDGVNFISTAFFNRREKVIYVLLKDKRIYDSVDKEYILKEATLRGYKTIIKLLLKDETVDPSVDGNYLLRISQVRNHESIVKKLLADDRVKSKLI